MFTLALTGPDIIALIYLLAAVLFIFGLKMLSNVKTARRGNIISALGMLVAVCVTFFLMQGGQANSLVWIGAAMAVGALIGALLAFKTPMTGMPQMVALLNGFGGLASLLVATGDYAGKLESTEPSLLEKVTGTDISFMLWHESLGVGLASLIGAVTFTGSLIAFGKLQGLKITPGRPILFPGQKAINALLFLTALGLSIAFIMDPQQQWMVWAVVGIALVLGVLLVIPIGGADMPVVICLLNSYSGLAAAFAGFVLHNMALIITGSLVGASGLILCQIMCEAMNRSLANVLFGGVGFEADSGAAAAAPQGNVRAYTVEDAVISLASAQQVVIVPGYGMAVAQAQHSVKELADVLESEGITVKYAIHPVAGRMPGHMNVLLAEANVPYEGLCDLETINPEFERTDVAIVIGANDVTNPAARHAKSSPIYGMPILDVDKARQVFVIKRSLNPGFAGVENELYFRENCGMLFGDAKAMVNKLVSELKAEYATS